MRQYYKVILVGEAFGAEEEKLGRPFVGQSGQLLRKALKEAGFGRYKLTNVCMWRPPDNRTPTDEEVKEELPRLIKDIGSIKNVILLGKTALKSEPYISPDKNVFSAYHPAFILRRMALLPNYVAGLKAIKELIDSEVD
jgi:uracil-DNA glycosylase